MQNEINSTINQTGSEEILKKLDDMMITNADLLIEKDRNEALEQQILFLASSFSVRIRKVKFEKLLKGTIDRASKNPKKY